MTKKRLGVVVIAAALVIATFTVRNSVVHAHGGGHAGGCDEFGRDFVASLLAGPGFGQFHRVTNPAGDPGDNADMVDQVGHALCN